MGKGSQPRQPAAPDPAATSAAQVAANRDAAITQANLNRIDQYTPQGSSTYSETGTNADGTPRYAQTTTYSPEQQRLYEQGVNVSGQLNDLAIGNIDRVRETQGQDFNFDGMAPQITSVGGGLPNMNYGSGSGNPVQTGIADQGRAQTMPFGMGGQIQNGLNYANLTNLPGTQDFGAEGQRMADSVYGQYASRLDPRFRQDDSDMRSRLAAQGISENSDAYRREADNFSRTRNDAYGQAAYQAQQAGASEQSRLFGLAMGARQQGQSEVDTQGTFANAAQNQRYSQYGQTYDRNNQAQGQNYDQAMGVADLFNRGQAQGFDQNQSAAGFSNTARGQAFNEQGSNAALQNASRQQQIAEASYLRNLPLNEIAALLGTGGGVSDPTFQQVAQVGVAAPDYQGLVQSNYNTAMDQYNRRQQSRSQGIGSIASLAGSAAGMFLSDRRLKWDIREVGKLVNGLKTYTYKYLGDMTQHFGVMAQDVLKIRPDAVGVTSNGYLFVDYGKVL